MKIYSKNTPKAFSIIEVMIGIFIFSLGLISIYALLASSVNVNAYNKNAVIAGNLAREQIELMKNLRDSNYENLRKWNRITPTQEFETGKYYRVFTSGSDIVFEDISPIISGNFPEGKSHLGDMGDMSANGYRVCLEDKRNYIYCPNSLNTDIENTVFYKYIFVEQAKDDTGSDIQDAFIIQSKVIWYHRGYHEYDIKTLITDWRRI